MCIISCVGETRLSCPGDVDTNLPPGTEMQIRGGGIIARSVLLANHPFLWGVRRPEFGVTPHPSLSALTLDCTGWCSVATLAKESPGQGTPIPPAEGRAGWASKRSCRAGHSGPPVLQEAYKETRRLSLSSPCCGFQLGVRASPGHHLAPPGSCDRLCEEPLHLLRRWTHTSGLPRAWDGIPCVQVVLGLACP